MRLDEVLDKSIPSLKHVKQRKGSFDADNIKNLEQIGYGVQSDVYHHKPTNAVVKILTISGTHDPSYQFYRMVLKHQDNPYFPRIYSIKQYDVDSPFMIVTMEKLQPLNEKDNVKFMKLSGMLVKKGESNDSRRKQIKDYWTNPANRLHLLQTTSDKYLKQAIRLMEPLFRYYRPDVHFNNIMIRSPNQFVFIDPINYNL